MLKVSMTFTDPEPSFQGHGTYEVEYLKKVSFTDIVTIPH